MKYRYWILLALVLGSIFRCALAAPIPQWTATWGSSQLKPYGTEIIPRGSLDVATFRQVAHVSIGGPRFRLHLSNAFGESPLLLRLVQVGVGRLSNNGFVEPGPQTAVHFSGGTSLSIPAGAEYFSDPIEMPITPLSDVVVTMLIEKTPEILTFHSGARATSILVRGDHIADFRSESAQTFTHWYFIAGIEVEGKGAASAVVTLGDSITDGHGATTDGNDRWPDELARRLAERGIGVVNQGIGGNRVLQDGLGPNALARFDRDVLGTPGVRHLIVLEGINDLGGLDRVEEHSQEAHDALVLQLEGAFFQIVERAHAHGIRVYGATLTPYAGSDYYHPSDRSEADRQSLNQWIRTSHVFDQVIDFDAIVRDQAHPNRLAPEADSGDHLHPGPIGYKRMGDGISLNIFEQPSHSTSVKHSLK
jgi:lysophospholipase L1-like esterase